MGSSPAPGAKEKSKMNEKKVEKEKRGCPLEGHTCGSDPAFSVKNILADAVARDADVVIVITVKNNETLTVSSLCPSLTVGVITQAMINIATDLNE